MDALKYCDFSKMNDEELLDGFFEFCGFEEHKKIAHQIVGKSLSLQYLFQNTEYLRQKEYVDDRTYLLLRLLRTLFNRINSGSL